MELVDAGHAKGSAIVSHGRDDYGRITNLLWNGVTVKGRMFADELQRQIDASSTRAKLIRIALVAGGFSAGALVQFGAAYIGRA